MAVYVQKNLPAIEKLRGENFEIIEKENAFPLKRDKSLQRILILNLMPTKIATETQLLRLLSASNIDLDITFIQTLTYTSRNTEQAHLCEFYKYFTDEAIKNEFFDGMIITGAPVEHLDFKQVVYWDELCSILDWAKQHIFSIYSICWGAQAALYHFYGIEKHLLPKKIFGNFEHKLVYSAPHPFLTNIQNTFYAPQSRYAQVYAEDILNHPELDLLAVSDEAGFHIAASKDLRLLCVTGHPEYDKETLSLEYFRDISKGNIIDFPKNYFKDENPALLPDVFWREAGIKLVFNWISVLRNKQINK